MLPRSLTEGSRLAPHLQAAGTSATRAPCANGGAVFGNSPCLPVARRRAVGGRNLDAFCGLFLLDRLLLIAGADPALD